MSETERPPPPDVIRNEEIELLDASTANPQLTGTAAAFQERPSPMLDVHTIHATVHGWRDFFVHIATIVVGLCIAVGIQQTVEFVHNRHQLAETRQALHLERQQNYQVLTSQTNHWRQGTLELQNNLLVFQYLQQHPGTAQEKLPGILLWSASALDFNLAVWDAAHQSGVIALMPREEIEANAALYSSLQREFEAAIDAARAIVEAERYKLSDSDPSHLSPAQVAVEIELTQSALSKHYLYGTMLRNLVESFPDFPATVTNDEIRRMYHPPDQQTIELLAPARAITMERLKAAAYVDPNRAPLQK
jgi:hypothetical protein